MTELSRVYSGRAEPAAAPDPARMSAFCDSSHPVRTGQVSFLVNRTKGEFVMKRFEGKTVLVTGGTSGIGLATALAFANEGARLVITGRDQSTLDQAKAQLSSDSIAIRNDAGQIADADALAEILKQRGVMLDAVFINAGMAKFAALEAVDERLWDDIFNTNVKGPYFLIKALTTLLY